MKRKIIWLLPGIMILLADRLIKWITDGTHCILIPGVLAIHSTQNTGAAMGLLSGNTALILILSLVLIGIGIWILKEMRLSGVAPVALSLIAGGAIGNIIDRVVYGHVKDMFEVLFIDFYIFNMADVGVVCGVVLCAFSLLFRPKDWSKK